MMTRILCDIFVGSDGRYRYFYMIHNMVDNGYYLGVHTTKNIGDGYKGSGTRLKNAMKVYDSCNFTKYIIKCFDNNNDLMEYEKAIVNESLLNDPLCYNILQGGYSDRDFNKIPVIDNDHNIFLIDKNDPDIHKYKHISSGKTIVKDKLGNILRVSVDEYHNNKSSYKHINSGKTVVKDKLGNKFRVDKDDPRIKSGELVGISKGYACMKDDHGNILKVDKNDPRIKSGELISVVKDTVSVVDESGNKFRVDKDDPRIKSGELHYHTENRITVVNKYGNTFSVFKNDPRIKSGELISVNKNRKYINKDGLNKMVYDYELEDYLENGWIIGLYKKGNIIVNKNGVRKLIYDYELEDYLENGWVRGQGKTKQKTGRPKKSK